MRPHRGRDFIPRRRSSGSDRNELTAKFPQSSMTLPSDSELKAMKLFVLGDYRLNSWILESGVVSLGGLPADFCGFILPLPNHVYPAGYSVGQAITPLVQQSFT